MTSAPARAPSRWSKALIESLTDKEFREAYVEDHIRTGLAFQIRALREQRGWSQTDLAQAIGTTQSAISRVEDPDYGRLSVKTVLQIGAAFDIALLIQYVDWDDWLERMADFSPDSLRKRSFNAEQLLSRVSVLRSLPSTLLALLATNNPPMNRRSDQLMKQTIGKEPSSELLDGRQLSNQTPAFAPHMPGALS